MSKGLVQSVIAVESAAGLPVGRAVDPGRRALAAPAALSALQVLDARDAVEARALRLVPRAVWCHFVRFFS